LNWISGKSKRPFSNRLSPYSLAWFDAILASIMECTLVAYDFILGVVFK